MKENYSIEEIIERYKKIDYKETNFHGNDLTKFLSDIFNGIKCDKCFFRTNDGLPLDSSQVEIRYEPFIENGEQLACLDRDNITIRSKDKRIIISTKQYLDNVYNDVMTMYHSSEDGLYYFKVKAVCGSNENDNHYVFDLFHYPLEIGKSPINVGVQQPFCFVVPEYTIAQYKSMEILEEDIPKLANKLFKDGLLAFCEKVKNGEKFEFTEEDNRVIVEDEFDVDTDIQESDESIEKEDNKTLNINQVIDVLLYLEDKGIELSEEQKNMIYLYRDVVSDDYKQSVEFGGLEEEESKTK